MGNQVELAKSDLIFFGENDELFTDSLVIAEETGYQHHTITRKIRDNKERFLKLGNLDVTSKFNGANPIKIYQLNEPQASFLITLLENNEKVTEFKLRLVQEFYRMREEIRHRREQQKEIEVQLEKNGRLSLEEYNNIRFSEKRTIKTFEHCDVANVGKLIQDFMEHINTLDAETRIVRCESAMKGLKRLHDRLAAENVMNIGNCYNLLAYIDQIKERQHITENKRNGGLKAAKTKEIKRLEQEINELKPPSIEDFYVIHYHPFSENYQYELLANGKWIKSKAYRKWLENFPYEDLPFDPGVDWNRPIKMYLAYDHKPDMDCQNFYKSTIDVIFKH
ncbi:Rha family transcriptional regulator [Brevibacillus thermoruber]|uniref:Rha family transcriptional regulator n=1 Tax=Brevibacillus thermoruber TaxID=33942 RepID=UPI0040431BB3